MANRRYYNQQFTLEPAPVTLFAHVTFGSTGAPTLDANQSRGIKSIVRNSAGNYTISLVDSYNRLLMLKHIFINSTAPASPGLYIVSEQVVSSTAPSLIVQFNAAGTATDPGSGEQVRMSIELKNSNA